MATPRIQSVDRAFSLLAQITESETRNNLPLMACRAGLSVATAHRLLATLESLGVVVRTRVGGYQIGMKVHELARYGSPNEILSVAAVPALRKLVRLTGFTAHVGVLNEDFMVDYVAKEGPARGFKVRTRLGSQLEAYCTGLGKVLLAGVPEQTLDAYLHDGPFVALTDQTIVDPQALRAEFERVRLEGAAFDDREFHDELRCVAVPVRDARGSVVAAMSLADGAALLTLDCVGGVAELLREHAAQLGHKLFPSAPLASHLPN